MSKKRPLTFPFNYYCLCVCKGQRVCISEYASMIKRQWVVSKILTVCCRTRRLAIFFFCMTLGRWGGLFLFGFLFGWAVRSHQWLWDWAWCTSNKVWSFLFFCSRPHIWSFSVISAKLPSFHTLSHLLTENLSVHMIINCYL